MALNKEIRNEAVRLRKMGFTYTEVAKVLGVSKSSVQQWLQHEKWSSRIADDNNTRARRENSKRISLLNTARARQNTKLYNEAERSAVLEFKHYKHQPLFVAGLMIYAASGDYTKGRPVRISGTRKETHRIFADFAREFLGVDKGDLRFFITIYDDQTDAICQRAWSRVLSRPVSLFHKTQVIQAKTKKKTLHDGVGNTIIGNTFLKRKLQKWVELASKEL